MSKRSRTFVGVAAALCVLAISVVWVVARESGQPGTVGAQPSSRVLLAGWPPFARGLVWLAAGAAAVAFDLMVVRAHAETERGKDLAAAFAIVTGLAFAVFAVATFADRI